MLSWDFLNTIGGLIFLFDLGMSLVMGSDCLLFFINVLLNVARYHS